MSEDEMNQNEKEALKKEILEELKRREALKKEILNELRPDASNPIFFELIKHPAFLLLLGFICTGVIGACLTSRWKKEEWDYQQKRLGQVRQAEQKVKHKSEVRDEVKKEIEDSLSADSDILAFILSEASAKSRSKDLTNRISRWQQSVERWRTYSNKLQQTVLSDFSNSETQPILQKIGKSKSTIITNVDYVLSGMESAKWKMTASDFDDVTTINNLIKETREHLKQLLEVMAKEIQADEVISNQPAVNNS